MSTTHCDISKAELDIAFPEPKANLKASDVPSTTTSKTATIAQLLFSDKSLATDLVRNMDLKRLQDKKYQKLNISISTSEIFPETPDCENTIKTLKCWEEESGKLKKISTTHSDTSLLSIHEGMAWCLRECLPDYLEDSCAIVAKQQGEIQSIGRYRIREQENDLFIEDLIAAPKNLRLESIEQKNRSVGSSTVIITHLLAIAVLQGLRGITLDATTCAVSFYKNQGFQGEGHKDLHLSVNDVLKKLSECITEEDINRAQASRILNDLQHLVNDLPNSRKRKREEERAIPA